MCYAFKQRSYWYIYDFLLDILFLRVVTISCVYPSLWIDIIMIFIYLEPYTLERNYISRWYPFFHDHLVFLVFISLVAPWNRLSWVRILFPCILLHSFVVKIVFPHACLDEAFAMSIGIPPLDNAIINWYHQLVSFSLFAMGCHKLCCYCAF